MCINSAFILFSLQCGVIVEVLYSARVVFHHVVQFLAWCTQQLTCHQDLPQDASSIHTTARDNVLHMTSCPIIALSGAIDV